MSQYQKAIDCIISYGERSPKVWVHEKMLYNILPNVQGKSKQEVLTCIIQSLCKGYIGNKTDNLNVD